VFRWSQPAKLREKPTELIRGEKVQTLKADCQARCHHTHDRRHIWRSRRALYLWSRACGVCAVCVSSCLPIC